MNWFINNYTIMLWYLYFSQSFSYNQKFHSAEYHTPIYYPYYHTPEYHNTEYYNSEFHNPEYHNSEYHNSEYHNSEYHNSEYHSPEYHNSEYHSPEYHNSEYHSPEYHNSEYHNPEFHNCEYHSPVYHNPNYHKPKHDLPPSESNLKIVPPSLPTFTTTNHFMTQTSVTESNLNKVPPISENNFDGIEPQEPITESNLNDVSSTTADNLESMRTNQNEDVPLLKESNFNLEMIQNGISTKSAQECLNFQKLSTQPENVQQNMDYNFKYPHRVALGAYHYAIDYIDFVSRAWFCGGSLINEKFVLTAAHCLTFEKLRTQAHYVLIGASSMIREAGTVDQVIRVYNISRRIPHPLYKPPSIYHDIALIELERPVQFSAFAKPACLYFNEQINTNMQLKTTGWQFTYLGVSWQQINETNLQLFSNGECGRTYRDFQGSSKLPNGIIDRIQICAGELEQDTCKADSGSPLEISVNNTVYLVGIKSFGNTCRLKGIPGIYTRIAPYIPWIESVAWNQTEINSTTSDLEQFVNNVEFRNSETLSSDASVALRSTLSERKCLNFREDKQSETRQLQLNYIEPPSVSNTFVAGGVDALRAEFPHMVALGYSRPGNESEIVWQCGGTLISDKFVLTAAHCLSSGAFGNVSWAQMTLKLDSYKNLRTPEQIVYKVLRRIPHPLYKRPQVYHDIALLELDRPVEFSEDRRPACLYTESNIDSNLTIIVTGWGVTEKGEAVNVLQRADLDLFNHTECSTSYEGWSQRRLRNGILNGSQICAGKRDGIQDSCPGDSGGPLQFKIPNYVRMSHIVGVTSFGKGGCGFAGSPGVYTRVAAYIPWIESVVWPDEYVPDPNQPQVQDA